jgi:hypothetical protein
MNSSLKQIRLSKKVSKYLADDFEKGCAIAKDFSQ